MTSDFSVLDTEVWTEECETRSVQLQRMGFKPWGSPVVVFKPTFTIHDALDSLCGSTFRKQARLDIPVDSQQCEQDGVPTGPLVYNTIVSSVNTHYGKQSRTPVVAPGSAAGHPDFSFVAWFAHGGQLAEIDKSRVLYCYVAVSPFTGQPQEAFLQLDYFDTRIGVETAYPVTVDLER